MIIKTIPCSACFSIKLNNFKHIILEYFHRLITLPSPLSALKTKTTIPPRLGGKRNVFLSRNGVGYLIRRRTRWQIPLMRLKLYWFYKITLLITAIIIALSLHFLVLRTEVLKEWVQIPLHIAQANERLKRSSK